MGEVSRDFDPYWNSASAYPVAALVTRDGTLPVDLAARAAELRRSPGEAVPESGSGRFGSSASSLHAKTFAVDGRSNFIGSFNLDRRSVDLNTEVGFVIDSPVLASQLHQRLDTGMPGRAFEVRLDAAGILYWLERSGDTILRHEREPGVSVWKRAGTGALSELPIDWLL